MAFKPIHQYLCSLLDPIISLECQCNNFHLFILSSSCRNILLPVEIGVMPIKHEWFLGLEVSIPLLLQLFYG